jgi:hypothetical protein
MARTRLKMPVRVIAGEKSGGSFLIDQVRLVADANRGGCCLVGPDTLVSIPMGISVIT